MQAEEISWLEQGSEVLRQGKEGEGGTRAEGPCSAQSRQGKEIPHSTSLGPTQIRQ